MPRSSVRRAIGVQFVERIGAEVVIRRFRTARRLHSRRSFGIGRGIDSTGDAALEPQMADYAFGSNPPYALGTEEVENSFRKSSLPVGPEPWEEEVSTNRRNGG